MQNYSGVELLSFLFFFLIFFWLASVFLFFFFSGLLLLHLGNRYVHALAIGNHFGSAVLYLARSTGHHELLFFVCFLILEYLVCTIFW